MTPGETDRATDPEVMANYGGHMPQPSGETDSAGPAQMKPRVGTKPLGPYFVGQLPPNPYSGARGVKIVTDVPGPTPDDSTTDGWIYNPSTGEIKANSTGTAQDGVTALDSL